MGSAIYQHVCLTRSSGDQAQLTSGHILAASTKTGMNATWPSTVSTTESPSTNSSLLRPSALLVPATDRASCELRPQCPCWGSMLQPSRTARCCITQVLLCPGVSSWLATAEDMNACPADSADLLTSRVTHLLICRSSSSMHCFGVILQRSLTLLCRVYL